MPLVKVLSALDVRQKMVASAPTVGDMLAHGASLGCGDWYHILSQAVADEVRDMGGGERERLLVSLLVAGFSPRRPLSHNLKLVDDVLSQVDIMGDPFPMLVRAIEAQRSGIGFQREMLDDIRRVYEGWVGFGEPLFTAQRKTRNFALNIFDPKRFDHLPTVDMIMMRVLLPNIREAGGSFRVLEDMMKQMFQPNRYHILTSAFAYQMWRLGGHITPRPVELQPMLWTALRSYPTDAVPKVFGGVDDIMAFFVPTGRDYERYIQTHYLPQHNAVYQMDISDDVLTADRRTKVMETMLKRLGLR